MANEDDKPIVSAKMDALRDKLLWSPDALDLLFSLMGGEELSWAGQIPDLSEAEKDLQPHVWTAYFTVKDYMKHSTYDVSNVYLRELIKKMARQLADDAEDGVGYAVASHSQSSASLGVAFMGDKGRAMPEIESLLKSLDQFKVQTMKYENRSYLLP